MSKVYIFLADGFEEVEGLTVVDLLRRAGTEVVTVSIKEADKKVTSSHGITLLTDTLFEENDFSDGDMLVLPGGMPGTLNLGGCQPLMDLLKKFYTEGRKIAAICAAPSIFGELGFLKGKCATSYPSFEERLQGAKVSQKPVVTDGNITTSRGVGTAIDFALSLITQLEGKEKAEEIAKSIVYSCEIL